MIDFVSTRPSTDVQARACARLLTAVIASAIRDACTPLTTEERREGRNINAKARTALNFLLDPGSVFPLYAALIGSSADSIRAALTRPASEGSDGTARGLTEANWKSLRGRIRRHITGAGCASIEGNAQ